MKIAIFLVLTLLAACSHLGPVDIGNGNYTLTSDSHRDCPAGSRANAVEDANDFCATKSATAVIGNFQDLLGEGSCTTSIVFTCSAKP